MSNRISQLLDAHELFSDKSPFGQCPFDLLTEVGTGGDCAEILEATLYVEGSHLTDEGDIFVYRRCGKTACAAEIGILIDNIGAVLDSDRFLAPCTGKP